jgi:hypothetical protein
MNLEFLLSNRTELQSYFGRVNATLFNKLIIITLYVLMVLQSWEKITNTIISHQWVLLIK